MFPRGNFHGTRKRYLEGWILYMGTRKLSSIGYGIMQETSPRTRFFRSEGGGNPGDTGTRRFPWAGLTGSPSRDAGRGLAQVTRPSQTSCVLSATPSHGMPLCGSIGVCLPPWRAPPVLGEAL